MYSTKKYAFINNIETNVCSMWAYQSRNQASSLTDIMSVSFIVLVWIGIIDLREVFIRVSKVIGFAFSTPHDWLKRFVPFSSNQK